MDLENYESIVMDFQNLISCIECHADSTNAPIILETLKTIVDICGNEDCGKDAFREEGGLDFLIELVSTTNSTIVLEHLLKTLALVIDENVHSQMQLTKKEYFLILQAIIQKPSFPPAVINNALLLVSSLVFQNSLAQSFIFETGLLQDIISLFEINASCSVRDNCNASTLMESSGDVLISANSTLCFAVNNPQNERNQEVCAALFPISLKLFKSSTDLALTGSITSFLSLCVASNIKNQQKLADVDGLLVLKRSLQKLYDAVKQDVLEFRVVVSKCTTQGINNIIGVITAVVSENEKNAEDLGKLGVVTLLMELLLSEFLDNKLQTRIMLALACCIDAFRGCKSYTLQFENFHSFLKKCFQKGDQEIVSASKYLLQVFLNEEDNLLDSNSLQLEQELSSVSDECCRSKSKDVLPAKKNVGANSVRSVISSRKFHTSFSKKKFLSHSPFNKDTVKHSETHKLKDRRNVSAAPSENSKAEFKHLGSISQPSIHKFLSPFIVDEAKLSEKSYNSLSRSVKSYRNHKKENILLIRSDLHPLQNSRKIGYSSKKALSGPFPLESLNSDVYADYSIQKNYKLAEDNFTYPQAYCRDSSQNLRKSTSVSSLNMKTAGVIHKLNNNRNENLDNLKSYQLEYESDDCLRNSKEVDLSHSTKGSKNIFIGCDDSSTEFRKRNFYLTDCIANDKNNIQKHDLSPDVGFSAGSLQDSFQFVSPFDFLETFDSEKCGSLKTSKINSHFKQEKRKSSERKKSSNSFIKKRLTSSNCYFDNKQAMGNYIQVINLPGDCCEQHKLSSNYEFMKVKPLKEAVMAHN